MCYVDILGTHIVSTWSSLENQVLQGYNLALLTYWVYLLTSITLFAINGHSVLLMDTLFARYGGGLSLVNSVQALVDAPRESRRLR
jgi:hypothetical protein